MSTDTQLASFYDGHWELEPNELAALFALKEWAYGTAEDGKAPPSADDLRQMISELVASISADGRAGFMDHRGRLLAVKHGGLELDGSVDVYLNIGFVWDKKDTDEEEFDELKGYGLLDEGEEYDGE